MWIYRAYRWPSQGAYLASLAAEGWSAGLPLGVDVLVSGTLYSSPPAEGTAGQALPGWHVATAFRDRASPPAWAPLEIEPPAGMPVLGRQPAPTLADYQAAITAHVNATAAQRGYESAVSCASYIASTIPIYAAEAGAFVPWRDAVWVSVHAALAAVQQGAAPPTIAALIESLPAIRWPPAAPA